MEQESAGDFRFAPERASAMLAAMRGALAGEAAVRWAYAFGSFARGEPFRDVDVGVVTSPGAFSTLRSLGRLANRLAAAAGDGVEVDLVDLQACSLPLVAAVLDEGVLLVDHTPAERRLWEAECTLRWVDFRPTWETQAALRRAASRAGRGG
ncbi:MAG: nucleotidyltransferase domain-containing protein [Myxococcota bacterium]|nr:nucleotidyltransferase domain-containing protein [Myxococcota bacterium]